MSAIDMMIVLLPTKIKIPMQLIVKPARRYVIEISREVLYINIRADRAGERDCIHRHFSLYDFLCIEIHKTRDVG
jgi:hypothetical protein